MEKSRLHYIDIIKGVCVALVIVRHAPFVMGFADNPYMDIFWLKNFFIPFFMAAFFMVTGFCSNYDRPFLPFLWRNVKGILLPAFCLYYLNRWLENFNTFLFAENPTWLTLGHWLSPGIRTFIADGGHYWFLSALFLAKTALWPLHRMKSDVAMLSLSVVISFCGVCLGNAWPQHNFFFLFNAMVLLPFLALGKMMKSKCKQILNRGGYATALFLVCAVLVSVFGMEAPSVGRTIDMTIGQWPLFLVMATTGSLAIWTAAQRMGNCRWLEYMGQGSLVIYAFNISVLNLVGHTVVEYLCNPQSPFLSAIVFLAIMAVSLAMLTGCYWLLNRKGLKILLGKF